MTENTQAGEAPVDFTRIQETSDGDSEFEKELFLIFLEDCEERVGLLKAAVGSGDVEAVHREGHTIKGAGANVGTTHLHEIAFRLEGLAAEDIPKQGKPLVDDLDAEFARVKRAITEYVETLG